MPEPVLVEWFNGSVIGENLVYREHKALPEYMIKEKWPSCLSKEYCTRMTFDICPNTSGDHILSDISTGPAICYVNSEKVFSRPQGTDLKPESFYFFRSQLERLFAFPMEAGKHYALALESRNTDPDILNAKQLFGKMFQGSALRFHEAIDLSARLEDAAKSAGGSEYAMVCVGTTNEIESEGFDRDTMDLTPGQHRQILAVAAANPRTIVVNFSGSPVTMTSFIDKVSAVVQAWFPGPECGHSLALVLGGDVNPGGRLPLSWPKKDQDNPTWNNFPCDEDNVVRYEEGLGVGYRYYDRPDAPEPLFPFGFGLSYTDFRLSDVTTTKQSFERSDESLSVFCTVENSGKREGSTVVQCYVDLTGVKLGRRRPVKELKDFQKVQLEAGESRRVSFNLDKYAFSVYDSTKGCWRVESGRYTIHVGFSSVDLQGTTDVMVATASTWNGL